MTKVVLNIDKHINSKPNAVILTELNSPSIDLNGDLLVPEQRNLNLNFLAAAGKTIENKRDSESAAIETMLVISEESQDCLFDITDTLLELKEIFESSVFITEEPAPMMQFFFKPPSLPKFNFKPSTSGLANNFKSIKGDITKAKDSIKTATSSINKFLQSINPMKNGLNAIKALAQFLLCPEESFIGDILNAFNSVVDIAKNIKPKELLQNALIELSNHVIGRFPVVNSLMNFFNYINRFFDTGADKLETLELIEKFIKDLGKKYDYLDDYSALELIKDLLNPSNNINKGKIPISGVGLPEAIISQKCSALGKLIAQLESSYRAGHRFEDIIIDPYLISQVTDKELRTVISNIFGVSKNLTAKEKAVQNARTLGYHDNTAINSTLSTIITSGAQLNALDSQLSMVNEDPVKYNELAINAISQIDTLLEINNVSIKRSMSMNEGLTNIKRRNDHLDISGILIG